MSCVLRAFGSEFDVDKFLESSSLSPCATFHKGKPRTSSVNAKLSELSGFNLDVSSADFDEFEKQMEDAIDFLKQNNKEIKRLKTFPGVENIGLDFAVYLPSDWFFSASFIFKDQLLKESVNSGVGIELSIYKSEDN